MIISKTPYRIPLSGGGTDLDFYYKKKGGTLYSLAINQYVYVYLHSRKIDTNNNQPDNKKAAYHAICF